MSKKAKMVAAVSAGAVVVAAIVVFVLFSTHILCIHNYVEATCTQPKTCSICGEKVGDPLGHTVNRWETVVEATCTEEGEKHGNCAICGEDIYEPIEKIPHTDGEWVVTENYVIDKTGLVTPGTETLMCAVCGNAIDTRDYTIELTLSQKNAFIKADFLVNDLHYSYDYLVYALVTEEGFSIEDAKFAADNCGADWDQQAVLWIESFGSGYSRAGLIEVMRWNRFTDEQIEKALSEVGY